MGIDMNTAMVLIRSELQFASTGPYENGKYKGWILHAPYRDSEPIFESEPEYGSKDEAKHKMRESVEKLKEAHKADMDRLR